MNENLTTYTLEELPSNLSWIKEIISKKEEILNEYNLYKENVSKNHIELHQVISQMSKSPFFNMIGTPIYVRNKSVLEEKNRLFCPRLFTPYEKAYLKYKKFVDKFTLDSVPHDDFSYMFKESLSIIKSITPLKKVLRADMVECKPALDLIQHTHTPRMGVMINLTDTEGPVDIIVEDRTVHLGKDEPLLVFDTSLTHSAKEYGTTNRVLFEIVLDL
jgi:hypothetical protein